MRMTWTRLLLLLLCATSAFARVNESLRIDHASWDATHVVVASEGPQIDGELTVIASWMGDVAAGDTIARAADDPPPRHRLLEIESARTFARLVE